MAELPTITEFFRGKNIFITGGSGFVGKVLVEKLLRSCPDLANIYLLMREKKGKSLEERIKLMTDLPLFDTIKSRKPKILDKIKVINGDVTRLGLGLSPADRQLLIHNINVIFHGAASVRFDDALTDAVLLNTRGTREVVNLALAMKNLDSFVHISTTYCNTDRKVIGEQLYPAHADWRKTIEIAETVDKHALNILTEKYVHPLPNTYTFTKSLAEHVVYDLCKGKIPAVIFRPSIVISTAFEPFPGWIDNFNGPVGLLVASGKGIIHSVFSDPDVIADYVPVDILAKAMIIAAWKQAVKVTGPDRLNPVFYNGSNNDVQPITMGAMVEMGKDICKEVPFNDVLWYPSGSVNKCYYAYLLKVYFYHLLPALLLDGLLKIMGKKPMLVKIQRRIFVANMALEYFSRNQWEFLNDKAVELQKDLLEEDYGSFQYGEDDVEPYDYFVKATMGGRRYLLKEDDDSLEQAKKHSRRMWILSRLFTVVWYLALVWLIFVKIDIISVIFNKYREFCVYLTE
ncbi:putative fatty acyl-CoA reductase CG5065 [Tribolium madens]|uniref:putative fatty acyl-CoA reductase CG5065 n=1 Tax=Tribolium madens TaxID=41895 RepID=UPI001CF73548|nr:putative fatty acyl-CoA reductase CG5065 [Tribolium madens]